jgi:hypothetical protein
MDNDDSNGFGTEEEECKAAVEAKAWGMCWLGEEEESIVRFRTTINFDPVLR